MDNSTIESPQQEREVPISRNNIFNYEPDSVETVQLPLIRVGSQLENLDIAVKGHRYGSTRVLVELDSETNVLMPAGLELEEVERIYDFYRKGVYCEYLSEEEGNSDFTYLSIEDCFNIMNEHEQGSSVQIAPYANIYIPFGVTVEEIENLSILLHRGVEISKRK